MMTRLWCCLTLMPDGACRGVTAGYSRLQRGAGARNHTRLQLQTGSASISTGTSLSISISSSKAVTGPLSDAGFVATSTIRMNFLQLHGSCSALKQWPGAAICSAVLYRTFLDNTAVGDGGLMFVQNISITEPDAAAYLNISPFT